MKWLSILGWFTLFVIVVVPILFVGSFFYFSTVDVRNDWEKQLSADLISQMKSGKTKIRVSEILQGNWEQACVVESYYASKYILEERFDQQFSEQHSVTYSDRAWGLLFLNKTKVKHVAFNKAEIAEPTFKDKERCLPFEQAIIEFTNIAPTFRRK